MDKQDIKPGDKITIAVVVESLGHDDGHIIVRVGRTPVQVRIPAGQAAREPEPDARWQALKDYLAEEMRAHIEIAASCDGPELKPTCLQQEGIAEGIRLALAKMSELED